jgi:hypothetical protein
MKLSEELGEVHMAHTAMHMAEAILVAHAVIVVVPIIIPEALLRVGEDGVGFADEFELLFVTSLCVRSCLAEEIRVE